MYRAEDQRNSSDFTLKDILYVLKQSFIIGCMMLAIVVGVMIPVGTFYLIMYFTGGMK